MRLARRPRRSIRAQMASLGLVAAGRAAGGRCEMPGQRRAKRATGLIHRDYAAAGGRAGCGSLADRRMPDGAAARRLVLVERCALDAASLSGRPAWPSEPVAVRGPAVPFASVRVLTATVTITLTPSPQSSRPHVAACRCCSSALAGDTTARTTSATDPAVGLVHHLRLRTAS